MPTLTITKKEAGVDNTTTINAIEVVEQELGVDE